MKSKGFFIYSLYISVFLSAQPLFGQNWQLDGNFNTNIYSRLGTLDSLPLRLITNNTERLFITNTGNIGVGTPSPLQKLHVAGKGLFTYGLRITDNGNDIVNDRYDNYDVTAFINGSKSVAVYGSGLEFGVVGKGFAYGVIGNSTITGLLGVGKYGVRGVGDKNGIFGKSAQYGVWGESNECGVLGKSINGYGIVGACDYGYGGYFYSYHGPGLRAKSKGENYAAIFDGAIRATSVFALSDRSLKKNVAPLNAAMTIVGRLLPKTYEFRNDGQFDSLQLPKGLHYGFLAEDIEQVLPNLVRESSLNAPELLLPDTSFNSATDTIHSILKIKPGDQNLVKSVNYIELIPLLVKAIQEQEEHINELQEKIDKLIGTQWNKPFRVPRRNQ
jgi:hypothetical protein